MTGSLFRTFDPVAERPRPGMAWLIGAAVVVGLALVIGSRALSWARGRGLGPGQDALDRLDRTTEPDALDDPDLGAAADLPPYGGTTLGYDPIEGRDDR